MDIFIFFEDITWVIALVSLIGNIFNIYKNVLCFYIWSVSEILWLILDIRSGTYGRAFLDLTQLIFAIWGIYQWQISRGGVDE